LRSSRAQHQVEPLPLHSHYNQLTTQGIVRATAFAFARHGINKLARLDTNIKQQEQVAAEIRKSHPSIEVLPLKLELTSTDSIISTHRAIVSSFERIDYSVNNAGTSGPLANSHEVSSLEDFRRVFEVNLIGLWTCQREQIRQMLEQEPLASTAFGPRNRGVIVNTASMLGLIGNPACTPATAYTATKHGVMGVVRGDSNVYAEKGIRINAICPGYVRTNLMEEGVGISELMAMELKKIPIGRLAESEEIAQAISFLASPMSSYMTGAGLVVDGGYTSQ
jgi:NAD(P)-dependent dehydrogenase (short-subunit alcohol dehydrogenase family)